MSLLAVLLLILLPGSAAWVAAGPAWRQRLDPGEALFLVLVAGAALLSWPAMLLAEVGIFSLGTLALASLLVAGGLAAWGWRRGNARDLAPGQPLWAGHLLLLPILALSFWLAPRPFPYLVGGRDHGIYINTGFHIARTGGILIHDGELAALSPGSRSILTNPDVATGPALVPGPWSEGQRLAGLAIRDGAAGVVVPHGFHLYPVWIAIFTAAGGPGTGLWATPFLALLGSLGIYFAGARLAGRAVAVVALLLVVLNVGQLWFQSYPTAEILLRAFFWAGLWLLLVTLETGSSVGAALAGLSLGLLHLTKLDTLFVPAVLLPLGLYAAVSGRWKRAYTVFTVVYLALVGHSLIHALAISTVYTLDQVTRVLLPEALSAWVIQNVGGTTEPGAIAGRLLAAGWPVVAGAVIVALALWAFLRRGRSRYRPALLVSERRLGGFFLLLLALPLSVLGLAGLVYPLRPTPSLASVAETLTLVSWYLLPLGLLLGLVGLLQRFAEDVRAGADAARNRLPAWLLLLANSIPLFFLGTGTYPDHFWAARRFVPVLFPALILGAAAVIGSLAAAGERQWIRWLLPAALLVALVAGEVRATAPVVRVPEYAGLPEQLQALADSFAPQDVLLFLPGDAANRVSLPLWLLHGRTVFQLKPDALAEPALAAQVAEWQDAGRAVYLLYDGSETELMTHLVADYRFSRQIAVPQLELTTAALPHRTGYFTALFSVFDLAPASMATPLPVAALQPAFGAEPVTDSSGLYPAAWLPGLTAQTWTGETATLALPAVRGAETLVLQVGSGRPEPLPPPSLQVSINGQPLETVTVAGPVSLFEWALPLAAGDAAVTVTLQTEPWIPAQTSHGTDTRPLGVLFYQLRLIGR